MAFRTDDTDRSCRSPGNGFCDPELLYRAAEAGISLETSYRDSFHRLVSLREKALTQEGFHTSQDCYSIIEAVSSFFQMKQGTPCEILYNGQLYFEQDESAPLIKISFIGTKEASEESPGSTAVLAQIFDQDGFYSIPGPECDFEQNTFPTLTILELSEEDSVLVYAGYTPEAFEALCEQVLTAPDSLPSYLQSELKESIYLSAMLAGGILLSDESLASAEYSFFRSNQPERLECFVSLTPDSPAADTVLRLNIALDRSGLLEINQPRIETELMPAE